MNKLSSIAQLIGALGILLLSVAIFLFATRTDPIHIVLTAKDSRSLNIQHFGMPDIPQQPYCQKHVNIFGQIVNIENRKKVEIVENGRGTFSDSDDTFQKYALKITYQNDQILSFDLPISYDQSEQNELLSKFDNC